MGEFTLLSIQVYGLAIVISLLVAVVIRGVVSVLSTLEKKTDVTVAPGDSVALDRSSDAHVAAIAAAVWAVVGPYRIVHIEPVEHGRAWTAQGRITHHASHAVRRYPKQWGPKAG